MQRLITLLITCLLLAPLTAQAWWDANWKYRKQISVDTTAEGAAIDQAPGRTPLLVRLHTGNFEFNDVQESGADLRFVTGDDRTVLNHQVERFDALMGVAYVWVDVPAVDGGTRQDLWLYYGNDNAPSTSDGGQTFDPNYTLVYHFDDPAGSAPRDSTGYGNHSTSTLNDLTDGVIGRAAQFNGTGGLTLPAAASLALPNGGLMTLSLWVRPDQLDGDRVLYARADSGQQFLLGLADGAPYVAVNGQRSTLGAPLVTGQWQHLAVTADGTQVRLYVDGRAAASLAALLPPLNTAAHLAALPNVAVEGDAPAPVAQPFVGALDELRLSRIVRPEALLRADAAAQGADSRLVSYGVDEQQSGMGFGALGFLFSAVPFDAWVILFILLLMMLQSWVIMVRKSRALTRMETENAAFRDQFNHAGTRLEQLHQATADRYPHSSLYRIYDAAMEQVQVRRSEGMTRLSPAALESVRASMDAARSGALQQLGARLGVLSNAIAGGPYIGLLGTVLGIMVVFLGTAMAGDVNINAIAPGMAAALLATAMGLFVAIPALFGYNRLVSRNKDVSADMRVFGDELLARLAERSDAAQEV
ncbi:DUF2341 domain-containing protein [Isoalcanivorax beigongshangi]|uniref:DUF2341 domain-containing protein n=1 Tax=Isoalcanivorax beigongshangi TaxID=3238810 RepID=A0ABV4ADY8_9GAMM